MKSHLNDRTEDIPPEQELDPVCGMKVIPNRAAGSTQYQGCKYYFCSTQCLNKFRADPESYAKSRHRATPVPPTAQGTYTCPMHPDVRQIGPGPCPRCGMALEPVVPKPVAAVEWTCPMHPEIIRPGPGTCPICGMALEPRTGIPVDAENRELRDMTRRFWFSVVLTAPLVIIVMGEMMGAAFTSFLSPRTRGLLELALASPVGSGADNGIDRAVR
jgi:Cu+-exporting ATPase